MSIQADNGSPHYPKRVGDVVIRKRGNSFVAELQTSNHDTVVWGPMSDTEVEALKLLGAKIAAYAAKLNTQALELLNYEES